jgi:UDP-N-acetyl-D-mannosaminuronic acid dehydrogenase
VALCGLTFKPDIDDMRSSPALRVAEELIREGDARLLFVEPHVECWEGGDLTPFEEAVAQADVVVRLVAHTVFGKVGKSAEGKVWLDFACR